MITRNIIAALLLVFTAIAMSAGENEPLPTANAVVATMLQRDAQRRTLATGYQGMRRYILENERMHKQAALLARVESESDGTKHFEVVEADGWKAAEKHVFRKMLASEAEASSPQVRATTQVCPENYDFTIIEKDVVDGRPAYALDVMPKRHEERLFAGRIWIDAQDYALVKVEGKPARNPSFWIKSIHFSHIYRKSGPFWYPVSTESVTEVRIFGTTRVTINYFDYSPKLLQNSDTASVRLPTRQSQ